jgi:hypothetical protein
MLASEHLPQITATEKHETYPQNTKCGPYRNGSSPAKRAKAYSLGGARLCERNPGIIVDNKIARERLEHDSTLARSAGWILSRRSPRVPLAKPRSTLGYML